MSDAHESLMPGPQGRTPHFYEVDRGVKTESYITAVSRNPVPPAQPAPQKPPQAAYSKVNEQVNVEPQGPKSKEKDADAVGLTEEELEPYRDDPFWKTIRLVLFILFWILWILLFLAAILLVVFSPGCPARRTPNWWQTAMAYNIWVPSFQDSDGDGYGDMQGLIDRLENLRKSGVQTVWPVPFLISDDYSNAVRSFNQMDPKLGVNQLADKAIESVHEKGMKFVISLPIATTSTEHEWFLKSASASLPENKNYSDFYYWRTQARSDHYAPHKGAAYLHEKNNTKSAVLNWQNSNVRSHMFEVLSSWIDRGVDGFHLVGIEYLSRSADGTEPNWPGIADVISDIRNHVDSFSNESTKASGKKIALFSSRDEAKEKDKKLLATRGLDSVINYELGQVSKNSEICHRSEGSVATCVHEIITDIVLFHTNNPGVWPQWEFGNAWVSRLASRVDSRAHSELLFMTQLILPGTNSFYYGDELGMKDLQNDSVVPRQRGAMQWDDSKYAGFSTNSKIPVNSDYKYINWAKQYKEEQSALKMFSKLSKLRTRDEALSVGHTIMGKLIDGGAYTVTRFHERDNVTDGNVYVAAVNFAQHSITLPLNDLPNNHKLKKTQIVTTTSNVERFFPRQTVDFSSKSLELHKNEGVVFRYKAV
ncbi:Neutral and basic amino acid transport protein rBAT [Trichostrongylus colubriformis]|uniref:Neutral and basic amino acid transport protein rBAT n=1 Tax=Trichostrongylus colubriformis TaxID=6319 RepID=A0AAN8I8T3_TRICO